VRPVFVHRLEVRFRDCDPLGHANNAAYLTYLEEARFHHWRAMWGTGSTVPPDAVPDGVPPDLPGVILARVEIDYRRPVKYGDVLDVRLGIAGFGRTSFTYEYELTDLNGVTVAAARTVIVRYDYASGVPVPISDDMKAALLRELV
jgi:acyl-CoA thioester hydrolase